MNNKLSNETKKQVTRLLKILSKKKLDGFFYEKTSQGIRVKLVTREHNFSAEIIDLMLAKNFIQRSTQRIKITESGLWFLKQTLNPDMQNNTSLVTTVVNNQCQTVIENINESPLSRLFKRKTKSGMAYLTSEEFEAGERLRKDFERGQLQPKISASLCGSIGRSGNAQVSSASDVSDFAIDSRKKVSLAIEKLGPELSGIVLDICCFLKGLELVERERKWPPRSAKLMLKTALSVLARHYGIAGYQNTQQGKTKFWGSSDYRPSI